MPAETLNIQMAAAGQQRELRLEGPLTLTTLFGFQEAVRGATGVPALIIDLAGVPYMDSAGLGSLVNAYVAAQKNGRRLILAGVCDRVHTLLVLTKVDQLFETAPDLASARAKLLEPA